MDEANVGMGEELIVKMVEMDRPTFTAEHRAALAVWRDEIPPTCNKLIDVLLEAHDALEKLVQS